MHPTSTRRSHAALLLVLTAIAPGCGGAAFHDDFQRAESARIAALRRRAAFDLECPAEQLVITPLQTHPGLSPGGALRAPVGVDVTDAAGVTGCARRAAYVRSGQDGSTWILNGIGPGGAALVPVRGSEPATDPAPPAPQRRGE